MTDGAGVSVRVLRSSSALAAGLRAAALCLAGDANARALNCASPPYFCVPYGLGLARLADDGVDTSLCASSSRLSKRGNSNPIPPALRCVCASASPGVRRALIAL